MMFPKTRFLTRHLKENFIMPVLGKIERSMFTDHNIHLNLDYSPSQDSIHLLIIEVPLEAQGCGLGTKVLDNLKRVATKYRTSILLLPSAISTTSIDELLVFYSKRGFVPVENGYYKWEPVL